MENTSVIFFRDQNLAPDPNRRNSICLPESNVAVQLSPQNGGIAAPLRDLKRVRELLLGRGTWTLGEILDILRSLHIRMMHHARVPAMERGGGRHALHSLFTFYPLEGQRSDDVSIFELQTRLAIRACL